MRGNTHFIGGISAGVLTGTIMNPTIESLAMGGVLGGIGGLIPDLDNSTSTICKLLGPIGSVLSRLFKHRGILHTPILWLALNGLIGFLLKDIYQSNELFRVCLTSLFWGEISHILLDSFTHAGVRILFPFTKKRYHIIGCDADGPIGNGIAWCICFLIMAATLTSYFTS